MTLDIDAKIMGSHKWMSYPKKALNFTISDRWDGRKQENTDDVKLSLEQGTNQTVVVNILAPFFEVDIGDTGSYCESFFTDSGPIFTFPLPRVTIEKLYLLSTIGCLQCRF